MPPEFAQHLQQLFARQMAVVYLYRCARHDVPLNLVSPRLEELEREGHLHAFAALMAEFSAAAPSGSSESNEPYGSVERAGDRSDAGPA